MNETVLFEQILDNNEISIAMQLILCILLSNMLLQTILQSLVPDLFMLILLSLMKSVPRVILKLSNYFH